VTKEHYCIAELSLKELYRLRSAMDDHFDHNEPSLDAIAEYTEIESRITELEGKEQ
jgi:hypothetical protein